MAEAFRELETPEGFKKHWESIFGAKMHPKLFMDLQLKTSLPKRSVIELFQYELRRESLRPDYLRDLLLKLKNTKQITGTENLEAVVSKVRDALLEHEISKFKHDQDIQKPSDALVKEIHNGIKETGENPWGFIARKLKEKYPQIPDLEENEMKKLACRAINPLVQDLSTVLDNMKNRLSWTTKC